MSKRRGGVLVVEHGGAASSDFAGFHRRNDAYREIDFRPAILATGRPKPIPTAIRGWRHEGPDRLRRGRGGHRDPYPPARPLLPQAEGHAATPLAGPAPVVGFTARLLDPAVTAQDGDGPRAWAVCKPTSSAVSVSSRTRATRCWTSALK